MCLRLKKELSANTRANEPSIKKPRADAPSTSRDGYSLGQDGLLFYKGRVIVPAQKALTQELLYLYHDDQFSGY